MEAIVSYWMGKITILVAAVGSLQPSESLEIHKVRTTPYRASSNGQVERYNRTLMDAVRCFIKDSHLHLQQIAEALRSSVIYRTGYTANKMMLGRELNIPAYLMFPVPAEEHQDIEREYI